jgi:SAM-dependent methyltransferase
LDEVFLDLGCTPPSNAFLRAEDLAAPETAYPLMLHTCRQCWLVQTGEVQSHRELFSPDYAYFSSYSRLWLAHADAFVAEAIDRLGLGPESLVVEVASNDGYLLQYARERGSPCLGIEPTAGTARAARERGVETIERFFGLEFARELVAARGRADLLVANNVLAHVPDINDFVGGIALALAPGGTASIEFPHLLELVANNQFDTVYHEHFSYFSLGTARAILAAHGLRVWDVQQLPTHGGSLRLWASPVEQARPESPAVAALLAREASAGMLELDFYRGFQARADAVKNALLEFLLVEKRAGRRVVGYGAAAKGNTLLNYAGVKPDLLGYVVDASPHKQGKYLPGSRIPVVAEDRLRRDRPATVVLLPWNLRDEIRVQLSYMRDWDARLVAAVPRLETIPWD